MQLVPGLPLQNGQERLSCRLSTRLSLEINFTCKIFFCSRVNGFWGNDMSQVLRHHVIIISQEIEKAHSVLIGSKSQVLLKLKWKQNNTLVDECIFLGKIRSIFYLKNCRENIKYNYLIEQNNFQRGKKDMFLTWHVDVSILEHCISETSLLMKC